MKTPNSSEQRVAGSEHRGPISHLPASISVSILRMHIRNDEALVAHYASMLEGEDGVVDALPTPDNYSAARAYALRKLGDVLRRLQRRRCALEALCTSSDLPSPNSDKLTPAASAPTLTELSQPSAALPGVTQR